MCVRHVRSTGFEPQGPWDHVMTSGRGRNYSLLFVAKDVRVSSAYWGSGAGQAVNKKIGSSGAWKILLGPNAEPSKNMDRRFHSTYVQGVA